MTIIVVEEIPALKGLNTVKWDSSFNPGEASTIIISPEGEMSLHNNSFLDGANPRASAARKEHIEPKLVEILKGVENGQNLIIFLDSKCGWPEIPKLHDWSIFQVPPLNCIQKFSFYSGVCGAFKEPYATTLRAFHMGTDGISYNVCIEEGDIEPLLIAEAKHSTKDLVVGGIKQHGKGKILFAPYNAGYYQSNYVEALLRILAFLSAPRVASNAPDWLEEYNLPEEREILKTVSANEKKISKIKKDIEKAQSSLEPFHFLKKLLWSKDDELEEAVKSSLENIGFKVVKGVVGHVDLLAWDSKSLLAIEVKGIEGTVKDRHTAQLGKWKSETEAALISSEAERRADHVLEAYYDRLEELDVPMIEEVLQVDCDAMLVITPFRKVTLSNRKDEFAANVLKNLRRRNNFAATGLQIFNLNRAVQKKTLSKKEAREIILSKYGLLEGYDDLSELLEEAN